MHLSITPLPGEISLFDGYYGIEQCTIRGMCRLDNSRSSKPVFIKSLKISLKSFTQCEYTDKLLDNVRRERIWWSDEYVLLKGTERWENNGDKTQIPEMLDAGLVLEIPFEIEMPESIDQIPPIPPFFKIESSLPDYEAECKVSVIAELDEADPPPNFKQNTGFFSFLFSGPQLRTCEYTIIPFLVWDPRLIPKLLLPDTKNWRSAPGSSPCEYDFEVVNACVGPGDDLCFSYRIAISPDSARDGVRINCVKFILREHHHLGDTRTAAQVKRVQELLRWEQFETYLTPPKENATQKIVPFGSFSSQFRSNAAGNSSWGDDEEIEQELRPSNNKAGLLNQRDGRGGGTADGVYAEAEASIRIPPLNTPDRNNVIISASTPKIQDIQSVYKPYAAVEIKHTLRVDIEFGNIKNGAVPERLAFECAITISCIGKKECLMVLDEQPELLPTLDYDKVAGSELWVPKYEGNTPGTSPTLKSSANVNEMLKKLEPIISYEEYSLLKDDLDSSDESCEESEVNDKR